MSGMVDVGGIRAKLEVDVSSYNAGVEKAKTKVKELGEAGKEASAAFGPLNQSLEDLGVSAQKIQSINKYLREVNPQILERQLAAIREELKRLGASADQIDKITKELQQAQAEGKKSTDVFSGIESALLALGGTAALKSLIAQMREFVAESEKMYNATKGLIEVSKNLGYSQGEATAAVQDMTKKGFMDATEAAQAYKTSLAMGLDIKQTTELINAMADAAAYNRQAHYGWGESIVVAMEGIKNGNSTLTDSVGVTKNLSVMQEEYARSIGTTAGKLTDAQKVQAAYNGFLKESQMFAGNASAAMADYTGTVAKYDVAMQSLEAGIGDSIKPLFAELLETITPLIQGLAEWVVENKTLVSGLAGATIAVTGFLAVLTGLNALLPILRTGFQLLSASMGPIGIAVAVIAAVAGGFAAYTSKARESAKAAEEMTEAQTKLNAQLEKSPALRSANELKQLQTAEKELTEALEERAKIQERVNEIRALEDRGEGNMKLTVEAMKLNSQLKEIDKSLNELGHASPDAATANLRKMREEIEKSSVAQFEMNKAEYDALAAKRSHANEIDTLMDRYKKLNSESKLTNERNNELKETINDLKKEYPDLTWEIDAQGRARITNIGVIEDQIGVERKLLDESTNSSNGQIQNQIRVTEANRKAIEAQINNYTELIRVMRAAAGMSDTGPAKPTRKTQFGALSDPTTQGFLNSTSGLDKLASEKASQYENELAAKQNELSVLLEKEKEMQRSLQNLKSGEFINVDKSGASGGGGKSKGGAKKSGKSATEIASELRKKAYDADIAMTRYQADMYDQSADQQIAAYEKVRAKHKQFLSESVEDERTLNLQLKRLREDSAKSRYEFSAEWISKEQRRMEDSGKNEEDIAQMKLDAWARLRDRYKKDSDEFKKADEEVYKTRKELAKAQYETSSEWIKQEERRMQDAGKSEQEVEQMKLDAWTRVRDRYTKDSELYKKADEEVYKARKSLIEKTTKLAEESVKKQKSAIDEVKKAELAAIEERKKAALDDYDARIKAIDDLIAKESELNSDVDWETQLAEKQARADLLASAVGPDGIKERENILKEIERMKLEHDRELRKRELESQKDAIEDEKDTQTKAFDDEKAATEKRYDELAQAFETYGDDIKSIESAISAFRVAESANTNAQILSDLDAFVAQYNAKMATISAVSSASSRDSDLTEYNANKDAWDAAKASGNRTEMARLAARNDELRKKYGLTQDTGKLQTFKDGGIVQGTSGSAVPVIAHAGEIILNPQQQATLWGALNVGSMLIRATSAATTSPSVVNHNHFDMSVTDVNLEDRADIETMYSERERVANRLRSTGVKTG